MKCIISSSMESKDEYDRGQHKYLVGVNLFNRKPEKGIEYLIKENFLDATPRSIAEFLFNRNCLSKQVIGEYISNTQDKFILSILNEYVSLIDLRNLPVDEALRKFQSHFRLPGEAQKIEHLTNAFSRRFIECNKLECKNMFSGAEDTIYVLAYAVILLNTSIHNPNVKPNEKMKFEQFVKMTKGIDNGHDIDREYLQSIYDRVKENEFKPGKDHTTSVMDFEKSLISNSGSSSNSQSNDNKPPNPFAVPHRRLVCSVQLNEIYDITKKTTSSNACQHHPRECFLFNDLLVITKLFSRKKSHATYTHKASIHLLNLTAILFSCGDYKYGIKLLRLSSERKHPVFILNARNENDQRLFYKDLLDCIAETNEVDEIRLKLDKATTTPTTMSYFDFDTSKLKQQSKLNETKSDSKLEITSSQTPQTQSDSNIYDLGIVGVEEKYQTVSSATSSSSAISSSIGTVTTNSSKSSITYSSAVDMPTKSSIQDLTHMNPNVTVAVATSAGSHGNISKELNNITAFNSQIPRSMIVTKKKVGSTLSSPLSLSNLRPTLFRNKAGNTLCRLNSSVTVDKMSNLCLEDDENETLSSAAAAAAVTTGANRASNPTPSDQQQKNDKNNNCYIKTFISNSKESEIEPETEGRFSRQTNLTISSAASAAATSSSSNYNSSNSSVYNKSLAKTSLMKSANSTSHIKQAFCRIVSNDVLKSNSKQYSLDKVTCAELNHHVDAEVIVINQQRQPQQQQELELQTTSVQSQHHQSSSKNSKYHTLSSSAGQKFRKMLSKYV